MLTKIVRNCMLYKNRNKENVLSDSMFEIIRYTCKHPGITSKELSDYLGVDKAMVARSIKRLVELGYIETSNFESDKRKIHLNPTAKAYQEKEKTRDLELSFYHTIFENITKEEQEIFFKVLEEVYDNSKAYRKKGFTNE